MKLTLGYSLFAALVFGLFALSTRSVGQDAAGGKNPTPSPVCLDGTAPPKAQGTINADVTGCVLCHYAPGEGGAKRYVERNKSNEFVRMNESSTWEKKDVHSVALKNLDNSIGLQMQTILRHAKSDATYEVKKDVACLACHSADTSPIKPLAQKKLTDFEYKEDGINCTVCHGYGASWQLAHVAPDKWRVLPPQEKFDAGMADLRNPAIKAKLCASCHVGSASEGKMVTHEMYAAGHPPLPPFELATFMESEPRHWGYPLEPELKFFREFETKSPDKVWATFRYHPAEKEAYLARHLAAGAIASIGAEASLLAAESGKSSFGLDYARFDCYACHHDLKYPSARQVRGYDAAPGRPTLKAWNGALPEVIAAHAATSENATLAAWGKAFPDAWKQLRTAAHSKPFGDTTALKDAANAVAKWSNDFLKLQSETATPIYTPTESKKLLAMLGAAAKSPKWTADPEAAMTLTWAYVTLRNELGPKLTKEEEGTIDRVLAIRVREEKYYTDGTKPKPIEAYLKERLVKFANYNPLDLTKALQAIKE